jgi:hypothetical protein
MSLSRKSFFWFVIICALIFSGGIFIFIKSDKNIVEEPTPIVVPEQIATSPEYKIIGKSFDGRPIESYTFGNGENKLLFIGGIHGGYEWNSVILAYQFIDYFKENLWLVPKNTTISIIPSLNPDGVYKYIGKEGRFFLTDLPPEKNTTGIGRFNARSVDLNRNFDCNWSKDASWRGKKVSGGTSPFSEPESQAIRDFVLSQKINAVISWHSQANTVYAGECGTGILPETTIMMNLYAKASGYLTAETFNDYVVTGDLEGWLSTINIPAITVELKTHETIEWEQNLSGIMSVLEYYSTKK